MTDEIMNLRTLLEKSSDTDLLREMIGLMAQRLMELEVEGKPYAGSEHLDLCRFTASSGQHPNMRRC